MGLVTNDPIAMSRPADLSARDGVRESLPILVAKLAKGAVGLFGLGGVLYGAGFLALRSHFSFLGIWSGVTPGSATIVEEGGRFFYSLLMVPAEIILQLFTSSKVGTPLVLAGLVVLAALWDARRRILGRFGKNADPSSFQHPGARLYSLSPACFLVLALLLTVRLLFLSTYWQVVSFEDVLRSPDRLREAQAAISMASATYDTVVVKFFVAVLIGAFLYTVAWPVARGKRFLIVAQWLLVIAAIATLPMAYGRLFLPTAYPILNYSGASSDVRLLIDQTPDNWIVWNATQKQTEIIPKGKVASVSLGPRKSLFERK